ncbi:MAG TPA: DNA-processing protein DprA, partial [Acidobacteriaceae bacterium]|nr:DNA-processing protein DprA [Acidobacteriaceae bacterium]
ARPVAVIGTRAATAYGRHVTTSIVTGLALHGITIISGAAYGIDATAHRATLATGTRTIAVLACGPDIPYPRAHADLLNQIATDGLILSEYPPGRPPRREAFLARNRIAAALATAGIIVTEATLRSGTLNTVGHARRLHRPIMAVPGPVTSAASAGCHHLIVDYAVPCITSADDALTHLAY